ncbi:unnamed protein product [Amoebophrya sp. A25]|nr:unnamed protein product [Amoebophrya sp. A25]|eukprot:GSA25T00002019001.1
MSSGFRPLVESGARRHVRAGVSPSSSSTDPVHLRSNSASFVIPIRHHTSLTDPYERGSKADGSPPAFSSTFFDKRGEHDNPNYLRYGDQAEFLKMIRKPPQFFAQVVEGLKTELRQIPKIENTSEMQAQMRRDIHGLLTKEERDLHRQTVFTNVAFSKPIASSFAKSALALPTMGSSIYSHMFAGLTNYVLGKRKALGMSHEFEAKQDNVQHQVPTFYRAPINIGTYYRTPILVEELVRMGYDEEKRHEALAKAFFLQYWSGAYESDPCIFNPLVRVFYPQGKHVFTGSNDLGRETEFQAARLYAQGIEGVPDPPLTIVNYGDTGPFTDGNLHAMQHILEARERGLRMPLIFLVNANNSSISSRLAFEDQHESVQKIVDRFESFGSLLLPGRVTEAEDVAGGLQAIRACVDDALEHGKPTWCISSYPFRPLGHASDGHPGADPFLLYQFDTFKQTVYDQVVTAADEGSPGSELAAELERLSASIDRAVENAMLGNKPLDDDQIITLSVPRIKEQNAAPGKVYALHPAYLTGKGSGKSKVFSGMGSEVYARAIDRLMEKSEAEGVAVRYVHQENHTPNTNDTRCGVYGELNNVSEKFLTKNFHAFLPNEAQVAQVGAGLRATLPGDKSVVFVKGPHTIFNEHARDHIKFSAFRHYETGESTNYIYIMDGGSLAVREKEDITMSDGTKVQRDIILARVGEHHNTPEYSSYSGDANTICALPFDINLFEAMLPGMVDLQHLGRSVVCFAPTAAFGALHSLLELRQVSGSDATNDLVADVGQGQGLGPHDVLRVDIGGKRRPKELIVLSWGPDCKWITSTLQRADLDCHMYVLCYNTAPNSLVRLLVEKLKETSSSIEVLLVDPNPNAALMAPVMVELRRKVAEAAGPDMLDRLHFSECSQPPSFVPYGSGRMLLNAGHLSTVLMQRGFLGEGVIAPAQTNSGSDLPTHQFPSQAASSSSAGAASSGAVEIVFAPIEAENALVKFLKQPGAEVSMDDAIAELETDKATIEIVAPCDGILEEFHVEESTEINVTEETKIATVITSTSSTGGCTSAAPAPAATSVLNKTSETDSDSTPAKVSAPGTAFSGGTLGASTAAREVGKKQGAKTVELSTLEKATVKNMTLQPGDTLTYAVSENVKFDNLLRAAKADGVSPTCAMVKVLGHAVQQCGLNRKLNKKRDGFLDYNEGGVNLGMAITVDNQLRVAVLMDVTSKTEGELQAEIQALKAKGKKMSPDDQDLSTACFVLTTLGKDAPEEVLPTLPRGITAILGVGRTQEETSKSKFSMNVCHATLNGAEGATLMMKIKHLAENYSAMK